MLIFALPLLSISMNYVPLLVHAIELSRRGTAREEAGSDFANRSVARSYSWRQLWILVPFAVIILDLQQRRSRAT